MTSYDSLGRIEGFRVEGRRFWYNVTIYVELGFRVKRYARAPEETVPSFKKTPHTL